MKRKKRRSGPGPKRPRLVEKKVRWSRELPVLFEDAAVVAIDKPAGLPSVPIKGKSFPSALSLLSHRLEIKRERAFVVHRIDRFTSGIILFAKTESDRAKLVSQFLKHQPEREYTAVIQGALNEPSGSLVHYLRRVGTQQKVSRQGEHGAERAELHYRVIKKLQDATLLTVRLETGFQNQIRVQFAAIGHALLGERKYSDEGASERGIARVALHASKLVFRHPRTGKAIEVRAPLARDIEELIRRRSAKPHAQPKPSRRSAK